MALPETIEALILSRKRGLFPMSGSDQSGIIPDVTVSELHSDRMTVTTHPVDASARIADHAIVQPAEVHCTFGWSDSSRLVNSVLDASILKGIDSPEDIYKWLLDQMRARTLFDLSTGKRRYTNVLITELQTTTNADTESCLLIDVIFQEVFLVNSEIVTLEEAVQMFPHRTTQTRPLGSQQGSVIPTDSLRM